MITFEYGTPYLTTCYGGIEHRICDFDAVWSELEYDILVSCLCDRCKLEVETYIKGECGG